MSSHSLAASAVSISKLARQPDHFRRPFRWHRNGRSALKSFLRAVPFAPGEVVLLPAYIGWSSREGSGVFDPIVDLALPHTFYAVGDDLRIDLDALAKTFRAQPVRVLILIHYFGYVDPGYEDAVTIARRHGALVVEDEAHAMLTDLHGGICGQLGDACIFSLHKLLPVEKGGMLLLNRRLDFDPVAAEANEATSGGPLPWEFDLHGIARTRRQNARLLFELLEALRGRVEPLWSLPRRGEVPQTFPVLIRGVPRDILYQAMNDAGFGVVSLYHTLVRPITPDEFPASHRVARSILNLPVHQDISVDALPAMVSLLQRLSSPWPS